MEEEEDVIFEGSALHKHLSSLDLIEDEDVHSRVDQTSPSKDSQQISCEAHFCQDARAFIRKWWSNSIDKITQQKECERKVLEELSLLLCSSSILTADDKLYLYHFSPTFASLVEEAEVCERILVAKGSRYDGFKSLCVAALLLACVNTLFCDAPTVAVSVIIFLTMLSIYLIRWHTVFKHRKILDALNEFLQCVVEVSECSIPQAVSMATELQLVASSLSFQDRCGDSTVYRVTSQCSELLKLACQLLSHVTQLISAAGEPLAPSPIESWSHIKERRRVLEDKASNLAKNILLKSERSFLNVNQNSPSVCSLLAFVLQNVRNSLGELRYEKDLLMRHLSLMRQMWTSTSASFQKKSSTSPEKMTTRMLSLHLKKTLALLEEVETEVDSVSSLKSKDSCDLSKEELSAIFLSLNQKMENIGNSVQLIVQDHEVLKEILNFKEKSFLETEIVEPKSEDFDIKCLVDHQNINNCSDPSLKEVEPYVAQDEFLEGYPEENKDFEGMSDQPWMEELKKEEQTKRLLKAQNKRVLTELQPILAQKKEEFELREKKAKNKSLSNDCPALENGLCLDQLESDEKTSLNGILYPTSREYIYLQEIKNSIIVYGILVTTQSTILVPLFSTVSMEGFPSFEEDEAMTQKLGVRIIYYHTEENSDSYDDATIIIKSQVEDILGDFPHYISSMLQKNLAMQMFEINIEDVRIEKMKENFRSHCSSVANLTEMSNSGSFITLGLKSSSYQHSNLILHGVGHLRESADESPKNDSKSSVFECEGSSEIADSDWKMEEKSLTLEERLQQMYDANLEDSDEEVNRRPPVPMGGLHFCSALAAEAVQRSSIFGAARQEHFLGGVGEGEDLFGCSSEEEDESSNEVP